MTAYRIKGNICIYRYQPDEQYNSSHTSQNDNYGNYNARTICYTPVDHYTGGNLGQLPQGTRIESRQKFEKL